MDRCMLCGDEGMTHTLLASLTLNEGRESTLASISVSLDVCDQCLHSLQRAPWGRTTLTGVALQVAAARIVTKANEMLDRAKE